MLAIAKARRFCRRAPLTAIADAAGLAALCLLVVAGFTLPALY